MPIQNLSDRDIVEKYRRDYGIDFRNSQPVVSENHREFVQDSLDLVGDVDTYSYNPLSNGVPAWYTLVNINEVVRQLLPARQYTQMSTPMQVGTWTDNKVMWTVSALAGGSERYDDFSATKTANTNYTFPSRDVYVGQVVIQYGDREVDTLAKAKIDAIGDKQYSASMQIAIDENKVFYYGNIASSGAFLGQTFGITNDPQLNAAVAATNGSSSGPTWAVKSANKATGPMDIASDVIVTAFKQLEVQGVANFQYTDRFILAVPNQAYPYLLTPSSVFGKTAKQMIEETFPNIKIVPVPEYNTLASFQLIAMDSIAIRNVVRDLFTYKVRAHRLVPSMSAFRQKWSYGTAGCLILNYAPIVTVSGIM